MKYLVTGDLHIKSSGLNEVKSVLSSLLKLAEQCHATIIAGDIFNNDCPKPEEIDLFIDFTLKLCKLNKVYIISGNHGILKRGINSEMWIHRLSDKIIYNESSLVIEDSNKKILIEHRAYKESKFNSTGFSNETESCKSLKYDVVVLGHIHKYQVLHSDNPFVFHPGSPYYITFGEVEDDKGAVILDISKDTISHELIKIKSIPMYTFTINSYNLDILDSVLTYIPKVSKLKLNFNMTSNSIQTMSQMNSIISNYKNRYHTFKYNIIYPDVNYTEKADISNKDIATLFNEFCLKEHIDDDLRNEVRRLL